MTDKEKMIWDIVQQFNHKTELLRKGYADAACRFDSKKTCDEIIAEADAWYEKRKERMVKQLISDLEPIMKGE